MVKNVIIYNNNQNLKKMRMSDNDDIKTSILEKIVALEDNWGVVGVRLKSTESSSVSLIYFAMKFGWTDDCSVGFSEYWQIEVCDIN